MDIAQYRQEFKHTQDEIVFMNHCGVSPMSRRCQQAMIDAVGKSREVSDRAWPEIQQTFAETRGKLAELLKVKTGEIAYTMNTTDGINWVANGLKWQAGDRIISVDGEYPANIYPWMNLAERKGVDLHLIKAQDGRVSVAQIKDAMNEKTRLVSISFVDFVTGFRADIESIGKLCRDWGVLLMVDLIQGAGALPIDLKRWQVDFAVGGAQKWLMGPQGVGYFYVAEDKLDTIDVTMLGAGSVKDVIPYRAYDMTPPDDARRFEYGTLPTANIFGMNASLDLLLKAGEDFISERIKTITDLLVNGLGEAGLQCISPRGEGEWSGIVSFQHPEKQAEEIAEHLWQNQIFAREREGYLRIAPHFYNTEDEVRRLIDVVKGFVK